jgi:hypothetical protein
MNETIKELIPVFEKVAAKIGESGEFVWKTVVKQQYVEALESAAWGIILLIVGMKLGSMSISHASGMQFPDDDGQWLLYGLGYALYFGGILLGIGSAIGAMKGFYNPEFYALEYFVDIVSGDDE